MTAHGRALAWSLAAAWLLGTAFAHADAFGRPVLLAIVMVPTMAVALLLALLFGGDPIHGRMADWLPALSVPVNALILFAAVELGARAWRRLRGALSRAACRSRARPRRRQR